MSEVDERRERVADRRRRGRSTRQIGEELGISHETVRRDIAVIEAAAGRSLTDVVIGPNGQAYAPKASPYLRDYEAEPGFDEPAAPKTAGDHLADALAAVDRALTALQEGHRQQDVPELLAEIRSVLPKVASANKALPKPPNG